MGCTLLDTNTAVKKTMNDTETPLVINPNHGPGPISESRVRCSSGKE
jgi:hypothetical protein